MITNKSRIIIIIDTKTNECYYSMYKTQIAKFIGVHRNTINNWINKSSQSEEYNRYKIYLSSKSL